MISKYTAYNDDYGSQCTSKSYKTYIKSGGIAVMDRVAILQKEIIIACSNAADIMRCSTIRTSGIKAWLMWKKQEN